jgi:excinuclease ABC subunit C
VAETVRELVKQLGLRDCPPTTPVHFDDQLELLEGGRIPLCIRAELGNCMAPCASGCGARRYRERAEMARRFLEGRGVDPLRELEQGIKAAAARTEFEYAALLRDRWTRLQRLRDDLLAFQGQVAALTFLYRVPGWKGDERSYLVRRGRILGEFRRSRGSRRAEGEARRLEELLAQPDPGPGALTAEQAAEILLVARWFRLRPTERKRTVTPGVWLRERRTKGGDGG